MNKPFVSVIIPVYNAAPWLPRCFESALNQSLRNIELICIDDASTDDSRQMLEQMAKRDPRIRPVYFEEHQGVSKARNVALDMSEGEYVFFLDADDWIDSNHLEVMFDQAGKNNLDVLINTSYDLVYEDGRVESGSFFRYDGDGIKSYPSSFVQSHVLCALCFRMYRLSYLNRNQVRFPLIAGGGEDIYFTGLAEALQDQVYVLNGPCYHYFQHDGSVVHMRDKAFPYIQNYNALYDELCARGIPYEDLKMLYCGVIELDSREKFDFIKQYITKVEPVIRKHPEYYTGHDIMLTDIVLSSPDYDYFRQHHHPNIAIEFVRSKMKKNHE